MSSALQILLPDKLYILRDIAGQSIPTDSEEFCIYYKNILFPYDPADDVLIRCAYGCNEGNRWHITVFPHDTASFPLTVQVYGPAGTKKAEKTVTVFLQDKKRYSEPLHVLCIGDSMTRSQVYLEHIAMKLHNVRFVGTRSYNGTIFHEGRGGWSYALYFENAVESPFLFPKDADGSTYAGAEEFLQTVASPTHDSYVFDGFDPAPIAENDTFLRGGKLMQRTAGGDICLQEKPELEFSFSKYIARHPECTPEVISLLMGANDLYLCPYENSAAMAETFTANTARVIASIRAWSPDVPIVVNLPVIGADSYSWGQQVGCAYSSKLYDFNVKTMAAALLRTFGGREKEHILLSPMLSSIDPEYGFPRGTHKASRYSDADLPNHTNWVHPCAAGYKQMGDALAGVLTYLRNR